MTRGGRQKSIFIPLSLLIIFILSLKLDPVVAGKIPQLPPLVSASRFLSFVGEGAFLLSVCVLVYLWGLAGKNHLLRKAGGTTFFSVVLGGIAVQLLKTAFERPRVSHAWDAVMKILQDPFFFDLTGKFNSFPSGHTAVSFAFASAIGGVYPGLRLPLYIIAGLIAASRVYLGSHYPTDVVAGAALGLWTGYLVAGSPNRKRWLVSGIIFLSIFISFFKTGSLLLFDVDEAVFSEASREMAETGDLITPTYNYEPRYDKPILIYWLMTASFKLLGVSEFAARLPSSLFGVLLSVMTFFFVRRITGRSMPACLSSLALLLNIGFLTYSHSATTDMTLAFFISASLFSFYMGVETGKGKYFAAFWAASALATLTKGAIGLVFPFSISLTYLLLSRNLRTMKSLLNPAYAAIYLVVALPWFLAAYHVNGWEFVDAFFIKHHVKRFTGVISGHTGPFYYYLGILALGFYPWVVFTPSGILRGFKEALKGGLYLFLSIWFLTVFVFFSVSTTKLPNYIFPLFPAASVFAGLLMSEAIERGERKHLYAIAALSVLFGGAAFLVPSLGIKMDVYFPPASFYALGGIFILAAIFSFLPGKGRVSLSGVFLSVFLLLAFLRVHVLPPINVFMQKELHAYSRLARDLKEEGVKTFAYEINNPSLSFYYGGKVVKVEKNTVGLLEEFSRGGKILVVTSRKRLGELEGVAGLRVIDEGETYILLGNFEEKIFAKKGFPPLARDLRLTHRQVKRSPGKFPEKLIF